MIMAGSHDPLLVILSNLIAMVASLSALRLAAHVREATGRVRQVCLGAAALSRGGGIWLMHFVAMLAFSIPGMAMSYHLGLTLLSFLIAVVFTATGFAVMNWDRPSHPGLAAAGLLIGSRVVAMHCVGMAPVRMPASIAYDPLWVADSVPIALAAASAAVWLAVRDHTIGHQLIAATVMG